MTPMWDPLLFFFHITRTHGIKRDKGSFLKRSSLVRRRDPSLRQEQRHTGKPSEAVRTSTCEEYGDSDPPIK